MAFAAFLGVIMAFAACKRHDHEAEAGGTARSQSTPGLIADPNYATMTL